MHRSYIVEVYCLEKVYQITEQGGAEDKWKKRHVEYKKTVQEALDRVAELERAHGNDNRRYCCCQIWS